MVCVVWGECNTSIGCVKRSSTLERPAYTLQHLSRKTGFDVIVVKRGDHWNLFFSSTLDRASNQNRQRVVKMNDIEVHVEIFNRNDWINPPENSLWWQSDHFDTVSNETLLLMFGYVCTPNGCFVSTRNQLSSNVLDVLIPPADVRPIPNVNKKNIQRCIHFRRFHDANDSSLLH